MPGVDDHGAALVALNCRHDVWVPIIRSWALTRGFALHPGTRNRYETRYTSTQHRPASRQVNDHGRVSGTHRLDNIAWAVLDLSGPYRAAFDSALPDARQVADPFHVVKLANEALDEVRRRVQNQTLGHRGRKDDPLYRARKLLVSASERISDNGRTRLRGLLDAGDPYGEVRDAWHAKETLRAVYDIACAKVGAATVDQLAADFQEPGMPEEINRLGRTLWRWRAQISNWHAARVTNAPTEASNNLIKGVKRSAFGFTNFDNYRIRALLYAGKPNWALLETLTPT